MRRDVPRETVWQVPDDFLEPMLPAPGAVQRRREAYVAFLWTRLRPPGPFLPAALAPEATP